MNVAVIIPTITMALAEANAKAAMEKAGCEARVIIVNDVGRCGFSYTVNRGIEAAGEADFYCIMSDDCEPQTDGWLLEMCNILNADPKFGFVCPTMPCRTPPICETQPAEEPTLVQLPHLPYGCVVAKAAAWHDAGPLDESFRHYASDTDHQMRAREKGWASIWAAHMYVKREVHAPKEPEWSDDRLRFIKKYGWC